MLTGRVHSTDEVANDRRKDHPRFHQGNFERNRALAAFLEAMAREKSCKPGQIALAWLLAQGEDIVAIPGTKQVARIGENLGALDVKLTADDLVALSRAFPPGAAAGTRYPAGGMKGVFI
jgi:aryl-alcohol dehydrogenase-like predicted oxidoreductase